MRNGAEFVIREVSEVREEKLNIFHALDEQRSLDFNAGVSLFVVLSCVVVFLMIPVTIFISVGLEINLLPLVIAIMLSSVVAIAWLFLSYVMSLLDKYMQCGVKRSSDSTVLSAAMILASRKTGHRWRL